MASGVRYCRVPSLQGAAPTSVAGRLGALLLGDRAVAGSGTNNKRNHGSLLRA